MFTDTMVCPDPTRACYIMKASEAAKALKAHGIYCRRDWGNAGRWLAEVGMTMYCVGGVDMIAAAHAVDPIAYLGSVY